MYRNFFKRVLDIILSLTAVIVLLPLMLCVAIAIYFEDRGKIIFRQRRVGANGTSFEVLKFRSMPENTAEFESAQAHDLRITASVTTTERVYNKSSKTPQGLCIDLSK